MSERREQSGSAVLLLHDGFRLDRHALYRASDRGAEAVALGCRAFDLLRLLVEQPGEVVSKDRIMATVWGGAAVEDNNLTVQISALRRILDNDHTGPSCIQTVPSRGYRFVKPVTAVAAEPSPDLPATTVNGLDKVHDAAVGPSRGRRQRLKLVIGLLAQMLLTASVVAVTWNYRWFGHAGPPRLSIVVLPFADLSSDPGPQYFVDAITEDLTTDLSRLANMLVISRDTALTYKDKLINAKQIGRELGVRYVLEGSVQRSGNEVRVNAQLIDAETDTHLWAERFDRDIGDLFPLQNEITSRIGNALNVELISAEASRPNDHPDALDYILRGRAARYKPVTRESIAEVIKLFEHALALDPQSAEAQSLLASTLVARVLDFGISSPEADIKRAEELATKAVAASPRSALAHLAKAGVLRAQRRCAEAIPEYEMVLALNRNLVVALGDIGRCRIFVGPMEEAITAEEQAIRLSPRDPEIFSWYYRIGEAYLLESRNDKAIEWLEKARSANAKLWYLHVYLASAYALKGETERAAGELAEARVLLGGGRRWSVAGFRANTRFETPAIRSLAEATYYTGLRKAGMPEE